jgi:cytochrome c-type biogenesis protein CcmH
VDPTTPPAAAPQQAAGALSIPVHLALGAGVTLPPTTTVFLIVRATDGSPMPLAVKRFVVADLPKDLALTQADAMVPGRSIAAAQAIELVARASIDGNVKPVPGDFEGHSGLLKIADITSPIVLTIDQPL